MKSAIVYDGPSLIDGKPIVAIAVWSNRNRKTAAMVQTYILRRDINPLEASKTGADVSICGDCPLRGTPTDDPTRKIAKGRRCYVNLGQGVLIVWKAFQRGVYAPGDAATMGAGRMVRLGTYGDPAAVPAGVWRDLTSRAKGWTGYTHQWRKRPDLQGLCMASIDAPEQVEAARGGGWRLFSIVPLGSSAINCPASKEAGARTTCAACGLCKGTSSGSKKDIFIAEH